MSESNCLNKNSSKINNLSAIDWDLCVRLANNKKAVAQEILSLVLQQLPQDLEGMQTAQARGDMNELLRLVHKLHGALCYCGMPALKEAVASLEGFLKQSDQNKSELQDLSQRVEKEVKRVLESQLPKD